ncbi:helix-turn-helix transcriptional regulator, partial [Thiolapillus sp.]|uniref:helix-turn-helix transcriptional regulator n=1 Tax=Thiolapillus sp. TaxID=2017437 RepID=UPI003AF64022
EIKKMMEENLISMNKVRKKINEFIKEYQQKMEKLQKGNENVEFSREEFELIAALTGTEEEQKELYENIKTEKMADKNFYKEMEKARNETEELKKATKAMNDLKGTEHEEAGKIAFKYAQKEWRTAQERRDKAFEKITEIQAKDSPEVKIIQQVNEAEKIIKHKKEPWTPKKQWLNTKETMELSKISRTTIHNKIKNGLFPAKIKIGKKSVWNKEEIEKWLTENKYK